MTDLAAGIIRCAFTVNPDTDDPLYIKGMVVKKYPFAHLFGGQAIFRTLKIMPPSLLRMGSFVTTLPYDGEKRTIELVYLGVPMSAGEILADKNEAVVRIQGSVDHAVRGLRANVVGLGGATAINGLADAIGSEFQSRIAVSSGNGFTGVMAADGGLELLAHVGHRLDDASVALVGAVGSVGKNTAFLLGSRLGRNNIIRLVGKSGDNTPRLRMLAHELQQMTQAQVLVDDLETAVIGSKLILTVSSAVDPLDINPKWIRPGAVIVDVARPRNVAARIAEVRDDVFIADGGVVSCPFTKQSFTFGFEKGILFACMAETILVALMGHRSGTFSIGDVDIYWLNQLRNVAKESGMKIAGWRSFEKPLTEEKIKQIASKAGL